MAQKDLKSVLQENRKFPPSAEFRRHATLDEQSLQALYDKAGDDYVGFWSDLAASQITWQKPFTIPLDDSRAPNYRWFTDGVLNVSYNCLDANLADRGSKLAIIA